MYSLEQLIKLGCPILCPGGVYQYAVHQLPGCLEIDPSDIPNSFCPYFIKEIGSKD